MSTRLPHVSARIGAMIVYAATMRTSRRSGGWRLWGLDPAVLTGAEARIPLATEVRLWERAAELSGDACSVCMQRR